MRAMSTTNAQPQQATCAEEEEQQQQHGRAKAEQQQQQQQQNQSQQWPRRRGGASRSPAENPSQGRRCARCGGAFGRFYNTGASCPRCRHRVCRQCREFRGSATTTAAANNKGEDHGVDWLCAVCHKIAELHAATGEWIYEAASVTSSRLVAAKKKSTVDIIKRSIRRAWTINGPPARWSVARKSPAFRIYRSLPVRDKIHPRLSEEADVEPDENFPSPQFIETLVRNYDSDSLVSHSEIGRKNVEGAAKRRGEKNEDDDDESSQPEKLTRRRDERRQQQLDNSTSRDSSKTRRNERETSTLDATERTKSSEQPVVDSAAANDANSPRVSLIKPPRIHAKLATNESGRQSNKHGDRKSSIPIFRRSSREFEDIGSPQETAKRSLIPQRYRGSTDDLRRSREDISLPSLIPKLFSPRSRDAERLKRHDSRDDVRQLGRGAWTTRRGDAAREIAREETRTSLSSPNVREDHHQQSSRSGLRIFRREDVGRETTSLPSLSGSRGKIFQGKDERHERSVGETTARSGLEFTTLARSKSCPSEEGKTSPKASVTTRDEERETEVAIGRKIVDEEGKIDGGVEIPVANSRSESAGRESRENEKRKRENRENREDEKRKRENREDEKIATMANEKTTTTTIDSPEAKLSREWNEKSVERDEREEEKEDDEEIGNLVVLSVEKNELIGSREKETEFIDATNFSETDFAGGIVGERKIAAEGIFVKRVEDVQQVVRRKFSKEELSNPDDTDETPNRRSSSHLSPEASPLSTRSSRYSPRESESEPTPALPRKTGSGDSCTASQRIRDAITRTRRESNSSARYESSGSESVRLSESGLHGYADLARRVKLFGSGGNSPGPSAGSDEPVQRDSATSAGEDDPSEDCHSRGPGSSQGRTMLRRRRQFDAQGSRRRGRSHARTCCGEELQNFPALHVIGRGGGGGGSGGGGRQPSPPQGQNPEAPNPDYRRLVFISSDSSSGREEDDADSSCSGSSYLKTRNSHAQSLEDCDWDYFESGTLPLPAGVLPDAAINVGHVGVDPGISQSWSCCPGRGSAACLACGGSPGANVLPVPVPIPVPVPYPVPVPASLWTGDFAAAASSMITRGAAPEGTLRLRGDPSAPWFSWHPRFNQPLHGARIDPRVAIGAFDPSAFGFRPEEIIAPRLYGRETLANSPPKTAAATSSADDTKNANTVDAKNPPDVENSSGDSAIQAQIEDQERSRNESRIKSESLIQGETEGEIEDQKNRNESRIEREIQRLIRAKTEGGIEGQEGRNESRIQRLIRAETEGGIEGQEGRNESRIQRLRVETEGEIEDQENRSESRIEREIQRLIRAETEGEIEDQENRNEGQIERQIQRLIRVQTEGQTEDQIERLTEDKIEGEIEDQTEGEIERRIERLIQVQTEDQNEEQIERLIEGKIEGEIEDQIEGHFKRQIERQTGDKIESRIEDQIDQIEHQIGEIDHQIEDKIRNQNEGEFQHQIDHQIKHQIDENDHQIEGKIRHQIDNQIVGEIDQIEPQIKDEINKIEPQIKDKINKIEPQIVDEIDKIDHQIIEKIDKIDHQILDKIDHQIVDEIDKIDHQIVDKIDKIDHQIVGEIDKTVNELDNFPPEESAEISPPESEDEKADSDTSDSSRSTSSSRRMYRRSRDNSGSSSGRSSADSSDLEDSASHRFSRVFVVNDDSLTSDNEIEDNEDSDSAREGVVTLRRVASRHDEDDEPVVLRRVRLLDEDANLRKEPTENPENAAAIRDRRNARIERRVDLLDPDANEIYLASSTDFSDSQIQLKSIRNINPDSIEVFAACRGENEGRDLGEETRNWDSVITPDSLEVVEDFKCDEETRENFGRRGKERRLFERGEGGGFCGKERTRDFLEDEGNEKDEKGISVAKGAEITKGNSSSGSANDSSENNTTGSEVSSDELHEYEVSPYEVLQAANARRFGIETGTTREKILAGGTANERNMTPMPRRNPPTSPLDPDSPRLFVSTPRKETPAVPPRLKLLETPPKSPTDSNPDPKKSPPQRTPSSFPSKNPSSPSPTPNPSNVGDMISSRIHEMFKSCDSPSPSLIIENDSLSSPSADVGIETARPAIRDACEKSGRAMKNQVGAAGVGGGNEEVEEVEAATEEVEKAGGGNGEASRLGFRSVERRPPARKENGGCRLAAVGEDQPSRSSSASQFSQPHNKYRSLVMITQGAYQPVSVVTSDTTTLLQSAEEAQQQQQQPLNPQGLAGYFHLALEAVNEPSARQRNGQPPRRPLMVKRIAATAAAAAATGEQEIDSGLSVGSASESDDVQNGKGLQRNGVQQQQQQQQSRDVNNSHHPSSASSPQTATTKICLSSSSSDENSGAPGPVILEEGLADDDSWVEEVSHDEDEASATTATEESSEDEANNLGDREEELRGYHRQAIDFTLHTIVEESCEESEAEPSLAGGPRKKPRPPSTSELEKYFFFGLGDGGGGGANSSVNSREVDSLSETSSIYSEGLESLGQEEASPTAGQDGAKTGNEFFNSSRLEKYFLSEFLGFDQDRRDSDGSVGSDSEGRPSPEAQRRKRLVRARGTGRSSHSSSLDNLLALAQGTQNLSSQNSLQDLSLNQEGQETQSEGSSTETDGAEDGQTAAFGTDGQFDTVKRKKKKPRTLGTQSPRVPEDRNKTPEPRDGNNCAVEGGDNDGDPGNSEDERAKTPQPESAMHSSSSSSSQVDAARSSQSSDTSSSRSKQQSRDSGFVGSCDDLLQHQKSPGDSSSHDCHPDHPSKDHQRGDRSARGVQEGKRGGKSDLLQSNSSNNNNSLQPPPNASLSRKDSFNNWSSDEETNLMMSKMRQFFKTMVANTNGVSGPTPAGNSSGPSPAPSPRLSGYSKARLSAQNRTKPPQLVYFENELTRLMKTVPGIRDEQVREIVEYLSSEDTWSDSYDSSDYTSSDLEGAAGGRRSALQEQISQSCQQIISKFDVSATEGGIMSQDKSREEKSAATSTPPQPCLGRDTAFVYQKLVQSFTKIAADGPANPENSNSSATPHSSPPLIAKVMHHIGSRLVALMHEVSEGGSTVQPHTTWRRYSQHHRTPSSASTTEDDDSTSDSTNPPPSSHLPRSKSHDPLLLINGHPATNAGQEGEEREASDYERFSWRGSFESALMAADSRTKLSLLACSGDVSASASASALAMAAKRRSAGDLLFNPKSFSREQLDRVRSCGSIGGGSGAGVGGAGGSIEEKIWSNRRRSSVPDANTRGESGASAGDDDTEDELEYGGDPRATTLPRGMQAAAAAAASAATNSLPRLPASTAPGGGGATATSSSTPMHKAHSVYHFLPQHTGVKSARYRPPGFARNSLGNAGAAGGPKRAVSAPGLQVSGSQTPAGKRETSRTRRQQAISLTPDDGSSLSEACSTPIIGAGSRAGSSHTVMDIDDMDRGLHSGHLATRASLSSLGARSDSMASVYSGAGEGRWCGSVAVRGEVEFSLQYDYKQLTFEVHVTQCKDLAPVDIKRNRSDPYVKVYLLPDKSKSGKRKTKVKKHTLNPVFDETLKFHMSLNGLETRTLWLTVWHSDMFGRNDFLGEVRMPLENKIFDDPTPRWYPLQERTEPFDDPVSYKGEVIVGLKFIPPDPAQLERERETSIDHRGLSKGRKNWSRGSLHVLVKEARNLQTRAKNTGTCDPFCKSYLLPDKGRSGKQKTGVVRRSGGSPVWTHTFVYKDVSLQELAERGLELTVWDHDRIASNEFLGGVRFNLGTGKHYGKVVDWMDATGRELSLWQSMLERPNFWVEGAVTLRPNLHNHVKSGGT